MFSEVVLIVVEFACLDIYTEEIILRISTEYEKFVNNRIWSCKYNLIEV